MLFFFSRECKLHAKTHFGIPASQRVRKSTLADMFTQVMRNLPVLAGSIDREPEMACGEEA